MQFIVFPWFSWVSLPHRYPRIKASPLKTLLTDQAIRRFRPPASGRIEITDGHPDVTGFTVRITAGGIRTFNLVFRSPRDGRQARIALGTFPATSLAAAREKAKAFRGMIEAGTDPRDHEAAEAERRQLEAAAKELEAKAQEAGKIEAAAAEFIAVCRDKRKLRQFSEYQRRFDRYVLPEWRGRHVQTISRDDCRALLSRVEREHGPVMANRVLATVRSLYAWLIGVDRVSVNPASRVRSDVAEEERDRVLSDAELAAIWHACDRLGPTYAAFIRVLALTAQRRAEVASLRWRDVDTAAGTWTLPRERSKVNRVHTVPLPPLALGILESVPRLATSSPDAFVFTTDGGATHISAYSKIKASLDKLVSGASDAGGCPRVDPWRVHDLRRTAASGMARLGVPLHVIEKVLGHESGSISGVAAIYNRHGYDREKRLALEAWANHVAAITDRTGTVVPLVRQR